MSQEGAELDPMLLPLFLRFLEGRHRREGTWHVLFTHGTVAVVDASTPELQAYPRDPRDRRDAQPGLDAEASLVCEQRNAEVFAEQASRTGNAGRAIRKGYELLLSERPSSAGPCADPSCRGCDGLAHAVTEPEYPGGPRLWIRVLHGYEHTYGLVVAVDKAAAMVDGASDGRTDLAEPRVAAIITPKLRVIRP
jgi:hypothetical protein